MQFDFPENDYLSFLQILNQNSSYSLYLENLVSLFENMRRPLSCKTKLKMSTNPFPGSFWLSPEMDEIWFHDHHVKHGWKLESDGSLTYFSSEPEWKTVCYIGVHLRVNDRSIDTTDVESLICSFYNENESDYPIRSVLWQNRTHPFIIWLKQSFQQEVAKLIFSYRGIFQKRLNLAKASYNTAYRKQRARLQKYLLESHGGTATRDMLVHEDFDFILKIMGMNPAKIRNLQEIAQQIKQEEWVDFLSETKDLISIHEVNSK